MFFSWRLSIGLALLRRASRSTIPALVPCPLFSDTPRKPIWPARSSVPVTGKSALKCVALGTTKKRSESGVVDEVRSSPSFALQS